MAFPFAKRKDGVFCVVIFVVDLIFRRFVFPLYFATILFFSDGIGNQKILFDP